MDQSTLLAWLEELATREIPTQPHESALPATPRDSWIKRDNSARRVTPKVTDPYYEIGAATTWITDAQAALDATFPPGHAVLKRWNEHVKLLDARPGRVASPDFIRVARGIVNAALGQVKAKRLGNFADSVRADTITELLDQAEQLAADGHLSAATVVGGGALETHLRHLCEKYSIEWKGHGSISTYNNAISAERKAGRLEIYSTSDTKQITAWGGLRNDAAHDPMEFGKSRSHEEVKLMILGTRHFISRFP